MNYKKVMSISVSQEVQNILKEKGNMSSYVNELILKDYYQNKNTLTKQYLKESDKKYYEVEL